MEEDSEVLDWGNEDDETQVSESYRGQSQAQKQPDSGAAPASGDQDEPEDAVSLGGDEDEDEDYEYPPASAPGGQTPSRLGSPRESSEPPADFSHDQRDNAESASKPPSRRSDFSRLQRVPSANKLTHALPPKPVVAPPPFVAPATVHPSTLASSMVQRERRANGHTKSQPTFPESVDSLPPDWEAKYPRSGAREPYYYNSRTRESTWVHPRHGSSGRTSLSKERENGSGRGGDQSPHGLTDDSTRISRKDVRRRVSPGGSMTYEDRHYRPNDVGGGDVQGDRRDSFVSSPRGPSRQLSPPPRPSSDRRSLRSPSPPPRRRSRSLERQTRSSRRDFSPPPDSNAWRDPTRDDGRAQQPPVQERVWGRPHGILPSDNTARPYDDRMSRGRHQRGDPEPPAQSMPIPQDTRNASTNEWSAPRNRSPLPHSRGVSPPRRAAPPDLPQRPSSPPPRYRGQYDRPTSPVTPREVPRTSPESYASSDRIPQRRGREYEAEYGENVKRRRVEELDSDDYHRYQPLESRPLPASLPDRPQPLTSPRLVQSEQPRLQKRQPLPSQSARFLEMTRKPPRSGPPSSAHQSDHILQHGNDEGPPRGLSNSHTPSGPRTQPSSQDQGSSDANSSTRASASSGRARTRFGAPAIILSEVVQAEMAKEKEALARKEEFSRGRMDVDLPTRDFPSRDDDTPYRQSGAVRNDRVERVAEPSMGAVPTGPRAMARNSSSYAQAPPLATSSSQGYPSRGPPPPPLSPVTANAPLPERSGRERMESSSQSVPHGPRSFENGRAPVGNDVPPSRRMYADSRGPVDPIPVPGQRTSGANAFPISRKRAVEDSLTRHPEPNRQPERADWRDPAPHLGNSNGPQILYETERRPPPLPSYPSTASSNHYRLPDKPDNGPQLQVLDRRDPPPHQERQERQERPRSPAYSSQPPPRTADEGSFRSSPSAERVSRFGPPRSQPPPEETEMGARTWVTRAEAQGQPGVDDREEPLTRERPARFDSDVEPARYANPRRGRAPSPEHHPEGEARARRPQPQPPVPSFARDFARERERERNPPYRGGRPQSLERRQNPVPDNRIGYNDVRQPVADAPRELTPPTTVRVHPDRARLIGEPVNRNERERDSRPPERSRWPDATLPPPPPRDSSPISRSAKAPIRIRRPPRSPAESSQSAREIPNIDGLSVASEPSAPPRPVINRGGSLLDRLSDRVAIDSSPSGSTAPAPSLRDRVELPMKRSEEIHGLPPRPVPLDTPVPTVELEGGPRSGRGGKRRSGKPRRSRR